MADLVLTRIEGFSFNSLVVDNSKDEDIVLIEVERDATPNLTYYNFSAPHRNGSKKYKNRYEDGNIRVVVGIYAQTPQERRLKEREFLKNIIGKEGRLIFNDMPSLFFKAEAYEGIKRKEETIYTELTINFVCSYCMYELYDDLRDYTVNELTMTVDEMGILVNRQIWESITSNQLKQITNYGNFETYPLIEISGTATKVILQIADIACSFANLNGTIFIDSENMIVYSIENGKKISKLTSFYGDFPKIPIGESDVTISGTNLNIDITIDYKNTYIV